MLMHNLTSVCSMHQDAPGKKHWHDNYMRLCSTTLMACQSEGGGGLLYRWPDLWHMTGLLAPMHPRPFAASAKKLPSESSIPAATAPPHLAMFELLRRPQLALGQGLIYKREPCYCICAHTADLHLTTWPPCQASMHHHRQQAGCADQIVCDRADLRDMR